jgi:hypothetical protein
MTVVIYSSWYVCQLAALLSVGVSASCLFSSCHFCQLLLLPVVTSASCHFYTSCHLVCWCFRQCLLLSVGAYVSWHICQLSLCQLAVLPAATLASCCFGLLSSSPFRYSPADFFCRCMKRSFSREMKSLQKEMKRGTIITKKMLSQ